MRLIAQRTGLHLQTVQPAVRALQRRGLVTCAPGIRGRLTYGIQADAQPIERAEKQNSDRSEKRNTRLKDSRRAQQPEAIPEAPKILPQPEPRATSTPVFLKADDNEKHQDATAKRQPIPEPHEECRARVTERHSFEDAGIRAAARLSETFKAKFNPRSSGSSTSKHA